MSTERQKSGQAEIRLPLHEDVSFEPKDIQTGTIAKFLIFLAVVVVLSFALSLGFYKGLKSFWAGSYAPLPPSRTDLSPVLPPEPRLQGMPGHPNDPQLDWREKLASDLKANNELHWIDEKGGIAQIPVKDAMKLIVEKGLPAIAAPPAGKKQQ
jgi:hypothetical protein